MNDSSGTCSFLEEPVEWDCEIWPKLMKMNCSLFQGLFMGTVTNGNYSYSSFLGVSYDWFIYYGNLLKLAILLKSYCLLNQTMFTFYAIIHGR